MHYRSILFAGLGCALLAMIATWQFSARADGIPPTKPLTYTGTLEEGGQPVSGTRNLKVYLWDDAVSLDSAHIKCQTSAPNTALVAGRFSVELDETCLAAVKQNPTVWVEVEVAGQPLGRTPLKAVPYAVEAERASNGVPVGAIVMWSGAVTAVPPGWHLCDGTMGTPDLRDRFVVGAGSAYPVGSTGGIEFHDTRHAHRWMYDTGNCGGSYAATGGQNANFGSTAFGVAAGGVTACVMDGISGDWWTDNTGASQLDNRPPWYALAYLMKL